MNTPKPLISIAPMMDYTDRHDRYFLRLIAPHVLLYTEMITAHAIRHGDKQYLLQFDPAEHPVALQLGGSDPVMLSEAAKIGEDAGYDEINLNVGCPSPRVSKGRFGACLMLEPALVADCIHAMQQVVSVPVTVKCRIGVDDQDSYEALHAFIRLIAATGCRTFIIHARKAWLNGLSPKENREIPPLCYEVVYRIKSDFPHLNIVINGGIKTVADVKEQLNHVDGVMIGRAAYSNPYLLADIQRDIFNTVSIRTRHDIVLAMLPYIRQQLSQGVRLSSITRHILGLYTGQPGAASWRRYLSQETCKPGANEQVVSAALTCLQMQSNN